jgi:hypothetical protein
MWRIGFAGVALMVAFVAPSAARPLPGAPNCPIFPSTSHWNQRVDRLPRHPDSDAIVRGIGLGEHVHADFGSGRWEGAPIGIPFVTVSKRRPRVPVSFEYADESDRGP